MPWREKVSRVITDTNTNNYNTLTDILSSKNRVSITYLEFSIDSANFSPEYCCFLYLKKFISSGTFGSSINFYKFSFDFNHRVNNFPRAINLEPDDILQFKYKNNTSDCEILIFMNYYECIGSHCGQNVTG